MTNTNIDSFKTYEGYEGLYIVEDYIRTKYIDTVIFSSVNDWEVLEFMDDNELGDECSLYYIDNKGNATYPYF